MGLGADVDIIAFLVGRYFGLRAFGEIYGHLFGGFVFGAAVGPLIMDGGFDATATYGGVLGAFALVILVAAALITRLGPYRFEAGADLRGPQSRHSRTPGSRSGSSGASSS